MLSPQNESSAISPKPVDSDNSSVDEKIAIAVPISLIVDQNENPAGFLVGHVHPIEIPGPVLPMFHELSTKILSAHAAANLTRTNTSQSATPKPAQGQTGSDHSEDFRSLRWFGQSYSFTPTQAACVRVLYQAWQRGLCDVGQATILGNAGSDGSHLKDVFRRHPGWKTLIVPGSTKGSFRLQEPS